MVQTPPPKKSSKGKLVNWKTQMQAMVQLKDSHFASSESKLVSQEFGSRTPSKEALSLPILVLITGLPSMSLFRYFLRLFSMWQR